MLESHTESAQGTWGVGPCAFSIEYSLRVLDDIRLAVVDAFFSLPRGGAEIGGVLLGRNEGRRVTITGYAALDCEHAKGPSFVLSANDHARLAELLASARGNPDGTQPVGWYHSHTRSEIHLSDADVEIHKRYFPEPWQVALVLKPHTFLPTRGGFFFQESDGSVHNQASYQEFVLEPQPLRPMPDPSALPESAPGGLQRPDPVPAPRVEPAAEAPFERWELTPAAPQRTEPAPVIVHPPQPEPPISVAPAPLKPQIAAEAPVVTAPPPPVVPVVAEPTPETIAQVPPPAFLENVTQRSRSVGILVALSVGLLCGAAGYKTRKLWLPQVLAGSPATAPRAPYIGLTTLDADGQLQIRWDRDSPAVRNANEASLVIQDSSLPQAVQLDPGHLRAGSFTYGRQSDRVDVAMTVYGPGGQSIKEVATYLGKLPDRKPSVVVPSNRAPSDQAAKGRPRKSEKSIEDRRLEFLRRKRLENQSPDSVKDH